MIGGEMHLGRRLMLSLFACVAAVSVVFALYQIAAETHAMKEEVERQAMGLAESQQGPAAQAIERGSPDELQALVGRFQNHERMAGLVIYDTAGQPLAIT